MRMKCITLDHKKAFSKQKAVSLWFYMKNFNCLTYNCELKTVIFFTLFLQDKV